MPPLPTQCRTLISSQRARGREARHSRLQGPRRSHPSGDLYVTGDQAFGRALGGRLPLWQSTHGSRGCGCEGPRSQTSPSFPPSQRSQLSETMGAGASKPEDIQALASAPTDYKPPLGPPNPVNPPTLLLRNYDEARGLDGGWRSSSCGAAARWSLPGGGQLDNHATLLPSCLPGWLASFYAAHCMCCCHLLNILSFNSMLHLPSAMCCRAPLPFKPPHPHPHSHPHTHPPLSHHPASHFLPPSSYACLQENPVVYFDIKLGRYGAGTPLGRVEIE